MNVVVYPAHVSVFVWVWHWSGHQSISMRYPRVFPRWDFQHCVSLRHENPPCYSPTDQQGGISWIWVDSSKSTIDFGENSRAPRDPHQCFEAQPSHCLTLSCRVAGTGGGSDFPVFRPNPCPCFLTPCPLKSLQTPSPCEGAPRPPATLSCESFCGCEIVGFWPKSWDFDQDQNHGILIKIGPIAKGVAYDICRVHLARIIN